MSLYPKALTLTCELSFETSQQAQVDLPFGCRAKIISAKTTVKKALADTDAGTVTLKNEAGTTLCTISHAASLALETETEGVIPANTIIERDSFLRAEPAKTTAGGIVTLSITYQPIGK